MHIAAEARTPLDLDHVTEALLRHNVKMHTFSRYFVGPQTKAGFDFLGLGRQTLLR